MSILWSSCTPCSLLELRLPFKMIYSALCFSLGNVVVRHGYWHLVLVLGRAHPLLICLLHLSHNRLFWKHAPAVEHALDCCTLCSALALFKLLFICCLALALCAFKNFAIKSDATMRIYRRRNSRTTENTKKKKIIIKHLKQTFSVNLTLAALWK